MATTIKFKVGGRTVSEAEWKRSLKNDLEGMIQRGVAEKVAKHVRSLRCPVHGTALKEVEVEVDIKCGKAAVKGKGCCEELDKLLRA